jgi:hypothetical protein
MQAKATKITLVKAMPEGRSPAVLPECPQVVRRASARPQYAKRLIDLAVKDETGTGLSHEVLAALDPKHRNHRLNAHLRRLGLAEHELPDPRDYRRYFNAR